MASKSKTQPQKVSAILKVSDLLEKQISIVEDRPDAQTRMEIIAAIRETGRMLSAVGAARALRRMLDSGQVFTVLVKRRNAKGVMRPVIAYCVTDQNKK